MDPDRAEELRLTFLKDAMTAEFTAATSRGQTIEGAGLGAMGVALLAFLNHSLSLEAFAPFSAVALLIVVLGIRKRGRAVGRYRDGMARILRVLERYKPRRPPP